LKDITIKIDLNISKNKILITGGSGFIGTNLCYDLIEKDIKFINLDINPPKDPNHLKYWEKQDIREKNSLIEIFKSFQPSHVINLAADLGMDHNSLENLQTNIIGVENIVNAINSVESVKKVVFTSSLLVCKNGYIPNNDVDYCAPNFYGESKVIGEKIVRKSKLNCEWTIIRPTSIWGPWFDYSYKTFFKMIDKNKYMHIGDKEFQKPACYVGNTVYMMMKILLDETKISDKGTYYLADYPWYSTKKWAMTIQKTLSSKRIRTAPMWLLRIIAFIGDIIKRVLKVDPPLTTFRLNNMLTGGEYRINNTKEICSDLPYNIEKAVFTTAKWMYEKKLIKHKPEVINSEQ
jgi:GlcNAc-P-P-Und epimerase